MSVRRSEGPRCAAAAECNIDVIPFSHCADPSLTCLVTVEPGEGDKPRCTEAHCGAAVPTTSTTTTTSTSTTTTSTSTTTTTTSTTTTSTTTTTTLPCVSTPGVSGCFEDLGNCTIRDNCTGLQWEKKQTVPGPHDVNNRYVWAGCCEDGCQTMCQPNAAAAATCMAMAEHGTDGCTDQCPTGTCYVERGGQAITTIFDWVNQLNAENFAGHNDWRLPPPRPDDDVSRLVTTGASVFVVEDDLEARGLERSDLVEGMTSIARKELALLFGRYDQIWRW